MSFDKPDYLVVYGDSYSDTEADTKKTNGPVWSQQLAKNWDTKLVSLAQPGATFCEGKSNSWLKKQVQAYSKEAAEGGSTVYVIFLGVTDLVETKGEAKNIGQWIQCVKDQVQYLCNNNPNSKLIVMGVPALEFSPYATLHESAKNLKQNIIDFNVALEEEVLDWQQELPVEFFDTYLVFSDLLGDSKTITNVEDAYWDKCQGKCNDKVNNYLWWDTIHVTGAGHQAISSTIESKNLFNIQSVGTTGSPLENEELLMNGVIPNTYTRYISWLFLGSLIFMMFYMVRHNRFIVSLKKKIQTKAAKVYPDNRSHHDYTLV